MILCITGRACCAALTQVNAKAHCVRSFGLNLFEKAINDKGSNKKQTNAVSNVFYVEHIK